MVESVRFLGLVAKIRAIGDYQTATKQRKIVRELIRIVNLLVVSSAGEGLAVQRNERTERLDKFVTVCLLAFDRIQDMRENREELLEVG